MPQAIGRTAAATFALSALAGAATVAVADARYLTVLAVEPKGGVTIDKEPFPTEPLPQGGGYVIKQPDATGRWEVSAYVFSPSQLIVNEGDDVTLEFAGINGGSHPIKINGYDKSFTLKRGHTVKVAFKADKAGVFPIICSTHGPSMQGELIVMAKK